MSVDPRLTESLRRAWLKDSIPVWLSEPRLRVEEGVLTILAVEKEDEGLYECRVTTEYDGASTSGRLSVLSEAPTFTSIPNNIRKCANILIFQLQIYLMTSILLNTLREIEREKEIILGLYCGEEGEGTTRAQSDRRIIEFFYRINLNCFWLDDISRFLSLLTILILILSEVSKNFQYLLLGWFTESE